MNKVILGGNIGGIKTDNPKVAKFYISTSEFIKNKNGEGGEWEKTFHNCVGFGYTVEKIQKLQDGQWVVVEGKIQKREYEGKTYVDIIVDRISVPKDFNKNNESFNNQMKEHRINIVDDDSDLPF